MTNCNHPETPGFHGKGLPAAPPEPGEVGGGDKGKIRLGQIMRAAAQRDTLESGKWKCRDQQQRENQQEFVGQRRQTAADTGDRADCGDTTHHLFRLRATRGRCRFSPGGRLFFTFRVAPFLAQLMLFGRRQLGQILKLFTGIRTLLRCQGGPFGEALLKTLLLYWRQLGILLGRCDQPPLLRARQQVPVFGERCQHFLFVARHFVPRHLRCGFDAIAVRREGVHRHRRQKGGDGDGQGAERPEKP